MKGILSEDKKTVKGPVTMEFNIKAPPGGFTTEEWDAYMDHLKRHNDHIASLPSILAIGFEGHEPGEVGYVEDYQEKFIGEDGTVWGSISKTIYDCTPSNYTRRVAIPSPKGEEQDKYPTYEQCGADKSWDEMNEAEKANYNLRKAMDALAICKTTINRLRRKLSEPITHSLTTEQLVAFGEAMIQYGLSNGSDGLPDMKTYLKDKLNIDIP